MVENHPLMVPSPPRHFIDGVLVCLDPEFLEFTDPCLELMVAPPEARDDLLDSGIVCMVPLDSVDPCLDVVEANFLVIDDFFARGGRTGAVSTVAAEAAELTFLIDAVRVTGIFP
jgi:hypothetical protein